MGAQHLTYFWTSSLIFGNVLWRNDWKHWSREKEPFRADLGESCEVEAGVRCLLTDLKSKSKIPSIQTSLEKEPQYDIPYSFI